jgi:hypothetical protein
MPRFIVKRGQGKLQLLKLNQATTEAGDKHFVYRFK